MVESTTPPPKHSNGAFIGVAILMVLGMGGLLFWKFAGSDEPPPAPPPVASAEPGPPVLDEPPPPPPPIEEEKVVEEPTKEEPTKRVVAKGPGGCGGTCSGGAPPALQSALRAAAGRSQGCYERALRTNSMLQGKMVVRVRISPSGAVCSASVASDSLGDPGVTSCAVQKFRGGSFPKPNGGCADVNVPISFQPKTK